MGFIIIQKETLQNEVREILSGRILGNIPRRSVYKPVPLGARNAAAGKTPVKRGTILHKVTGTKQLREMLMVKGVTVSYINNVAIFF